MRTSLNEIKSIEDFIFSNMPGGDAQLFEALLILEPALRQQVQLQHKTYGIIGQYGRKQLLAEIEEVHQNLCTRAENKGFMQSIMLMFQHR